MVNLDRKLKLELEGAGLIRPLEVIDQDIKRIEGAKHPSIKAELTPIESIKKDNEANKAFLTEKLTGFIEKPQNPPLSGQEICSKGIFLSA